MLVINLRDPQRVYAPGDEVAGQVIFNPPDTYKSLPVRMVIYLQGRSKVKLRGSSDDRKNTYRGRAMLLRTIVADIQGTETVWPFRFLFPARVQVDNPEMGDTRDQTSHMFTIPPNHPLPPTFSQAPSGMFSSSNVYFVEYGVTVCVWPVTQKKSRLLCQQTVPLIFQGNPDQQQWMGQDPAWDISVAQKDHRANTLLLLPENKGRDLTFREKTKSLFNRSKLPSFEFKATTTQPRRLQLGQNISCTLRIEPSPLTSTAPEPKFTLTRFWMAIESRTDLYAAALLGDRNAGEIENLNKMKRKYVDEEFLPETGYTKIITAPPVTDIIPSFTTFNIAREYSLTTYIRIECAGQAFYVMNTSDLTVLPALRGVPMGPHQTEIECVDGPLLYPKNDKVPVPGYNDVSKDTPPPPKYSKG